MENKTLKNLRKRILRSKNTWSVGGDLMLALEFQEMPLSELTLLKNFIEGHKNPTNYVELNRRIETILKKALI